MKHISMSKKPILIMYICTMTLMLRIGLTMPMTKRVRTTQKYTLEQLPLDLMYHILGFAGSSRIDSIQKVGYTLRSVSKKMRNFFDSKQYSNIPIALWFLFEHARKGNEVGVKDCLNYVMNKQYRPDQLMLSTDLRGNYLLQYLAQAQLKDVAIACSKLYVDFKHARKGTELRAFLNAVENGKVSVVKQMLVDGVHPDFGISLSKCNVPKEFIYKKPKQKSLKRKSYTPLRDARVPFERAMYLASKRFMIPEIVELLIDFGTNPDLSVDALRSAYRCRNIALVRKVLAKIHLRPHGSLLLGEELRNPTLNYLEQVILTSLMFDTEFVEECIEKKYIRVNTMLVPGILLSDNLPGPNSIFSSKIITTKIVDFLCTKKFSLENRAHGLTPLLAAAKANREDLVDRFIKMGADVNVVDGDGYSPMSYAHDRKNQKMVSMLHKAGASKDFKMMKRRMVKMWSGNLE